MLLAIVSYVVGACCLATCLMLCLVQWSQFNISWPQAQLSFPFTTKLCLPLHSGQDHRYEWHLWNLSLGGPLQKKKKLKNRLSPNLQFRKSDGCDFKLRNTIFFSMKEGVRVCVSLIGFSSPQVCLQSQPNGCLAPGIAASYKRPQTKWFNNQAYGLKVCGLLQEQCVMES